MHRLVPPQEALPHSRGGVPHARHELLFWVAQGGFWLAVCAAGMIVIRAFQPAFADPAWFVGSRAACGCAFTALIHSLSQRDDFLRRLGISGPGLMIGGPLLGAVLITLLMAALESGVDRASLRLGLPAGFVLNGTALATWSAIFFSYQLLQERQSTEMRALEAESLAYRNELRHLQSQISPHFLFNALNTILACKDDPDAVESVTQSLAKYLRFLLRPADTLEPLGREIDALEDYLTVQAARFGDKLVCRIDCEADIRRIPVLPVMIQPLVENALNYGPTEAGTLLRVDIQARRRGDLLFIEVANTGHWIPPNPAASPNTGLHTLRRRLLLRGGPEATVTTTALDGWVRVVIQIPLAGEYAGGPDEALRKTPVPLGGNRAELTA